MDPTDDSLDEPDETLSVAGVAGGLTVSSASVEIADDDPAPTVSVGDAAAVTEGDDPETTSDMTFTVTLSAVSGKPVTVTYSLDEPTESVSVAGSAGGLTVSSSSVSITDDDAAPTVSVGDAAAVASFDLDPRVMSPPISVVAGSAGGLTVSSSSVSTDDDADGVGG